MEFTEDETSELLNDSNSFNVSDTRDGDLHSSRGERKYTYEEAIKATGYGRFHYTLLILCGWALSSDAIEVLGISFILPPATCDLDLSDTDKAWINSAIFLGMMVGGYLWGSLADIKGRRAVLMWSLALNALGGLASSFAQSYWLFVVLRVISGIGVGGSLPVIFAYYAEFQPKNKRGAMISMLATFWMFGNVMAAALAWVVIPRDFSVTHKDFRYNTWRLYLALCVLPSLSSVFFFFLMPESPRFLMENGKEQEAIKVLNRIVKANTGSRSGSKYEVQQLQIERSIRLSISGSWLKDQFTTFRNNTRSLFRRPLTSITVVMLIIHFTLAFGYYGLFMWFPQLFQRIELYGGSACHLGNMSGNTTSPAVICQVSSTVYFEGFLTAISNLPGNILTILIIDKVGRKSLLAVSMVISGLCVFFVWFMKTSLDNLILSCVFSGVSVIGFNVLDVLGAELFPTNLRTTAAGVLLIVARIAAILGNQVFGLLVATNCAVPMILVAVLMSVGGLTALILPNTTRTDLL